MSGATKINGCHAHRGFNEIDYADFNMAYNTSKKMKCLKLSGNFKVLSGIGHDAIKYLFKEICLAFKIEHMYHLLDDI